MKYTLKNTFEGFEPTKQPYCPESVNEALELVRTGHANIMPKSISDLAMDLNYVEWQAMCLRDRLQDECAAGRLSADDEL